MLVVELVLWWYGQGWIHVVRTAGQRLRRIILAFSLPLLLRTLFAPWRRIISYGDRSIGERMRAVLDNAISRLVGLVVRLVVLVAACILIFLSAILSAFAIIAWPFLPIAAIGLIIRGLLPW